MLGAGSSNATVSPMTVAAIVGLRLCLHAITIPLETTGLSIRILRDPHVRAATLTVTRALTMVVYGTSILYTLYTLFCIHSFLYSPCNPARGSTHCVQMSMNPQNRIF